MNGAQLDRLVDPGEMRAKALAAQKAMDWPQALRDWERVIDRSRATDAQRKEAVAHVHDLRMKVRTEGQGRPWPTLVVLFRHMDVDWKDKSGAAHHFQSTLTDDDAATIRKAFETYQGYVYRYTRGFLRIQPEFKTVEEPLTKLVGDGAYWVGPDTERPTLLRLMGRRKFQSLFVYEKFREGNDAIPGAFWGGTYGADQGLNGAAFSEILWSENPPTDGEVELHEWLHQIDWMFTTVLGYPQAASITPDNGRHLGEQGGDLDFRLPASALNWMDFYVHIMTDHITDEMWSEATMHDPASNPWLADRRRGS